MATAFRDWPWPLQALFFLGLAVVLIAAGFYVPGSPVATVRNELEAGSGGRKAFGSRRRQPARLQTAPRRAAIRNGCAFQTARHPADHCSRRQKSGRVHPHDPERCRQLPASPFAALRRSPSLPNSSISRSRLKSRPMVRTSPSWIFFPSSAGSRGSSMLAI